MIHHDRVQPCCYFPRFQMIYFKAYIIFTRIYATKLPQLHLQFLRCSPGSLCRPPSSVRRQVTLRWSPRRHSRGCQRSGPDCLGRVETPSNFSWWIWLEQNAPLRSAWKYTPDRNYPISNFNWLWATPHHHHRCRHHIYISTTLSPLAMQLSD